MRSKSSLSILLVEDDRFYADLIKDNLIRNGFPIVRHAKNGIECLIEVFEKKAPDVVIMDHQLGKLNGLELLQRIRANKPATKVLFLSAVNKVDVATSALKFGAMDFFGKDEHVFENLIPALSQIYEEKSRMAPFAWISRIS